MHPSLAKHLHSDECIEWIKEYEQCNKENKFMRYMGVCVNIQNQMTKCIQNELNKRRNLGSEKKRQTQLEEHLKNNPKLAEKLKLLEELKTKAAKEAKK